MEKDLKRWLAEKRATRTIQNLKKNYFEAVYLNDAKETYDYILNMIPENACIGMGDSLTLEEIGLVKELENGSYDFLNPWRKGITRPESLALRRRALTSDIFLTGTNAVTMDGKLVSIDGLGNRVAGMIFGPEKVVVVAGINKIAANVDEAISRTKNIAATVNARKHDFDPPLRSPCADTGFCSECRPPKRLCCKTVIIEACSRDQGRMTVIIVGEELGY